jgi:serine/threonine protein phosphatase PrpC
MIIRSDVELANMSDVGCVRSINEDYFLYIEPQEDQDFAQRGRLLMVADGMGGHKGGQIASGLAVEVIQRAFLTSVSDDPRAFLIAAFEDAHRAIMEAANANDGLEGMGTTCCAAILKDGWLTFGHIGDSRLYLMRDAHAHALTDDHTVVNALLKRGVLTAEEARNHNQRNILTAALGAASTTIAGDFVESPLQLQAEDVLLMCSDGLYNLVTDEEMASLTSIYSLTDACRQLVALAKKRGGSDNITIQLLRVREVPA